MKQIIDFLLQEFSKNNTTAYLSSIPHSSDSIIREDKSIIGYIPLNEDIVKQMQEKHYVFRKLFNDNLVLIGERDGVRIDFLIIKDEIVKNNTTNSYIRLCVPFSDRNKLKQFLKKYHINIQCLVKELEKMQNELAKIQKALVDYTNMVVFLNDGD